MKREREGESKRSGRKRNRRRKKEERELLIKRKGLVGVGENKERKKWGTNRKEITFGTERRGREMIAVGAKG